MISPAQKTLFLPFEDEILDFVQAGETWLSCGITADPTMSDELKAGMLVLQPSRPDFLKLQKYGFNSCARVPEDLRADGGLMLLGKHKGRNEDWFAQLLQHVKPDGLIAVCGDKKLGIDSFRKWVSSRFEVIDRMSKNHAVVFWLKRPTNISDDEIGSLRPLSKTIDDFYETSPGMFSHGEIDKGSALLVPHMSGILFGKVADFGAGWGYLSSQALQHSSKIQQIDLYEADFEALEAAKTNLAKINTTIPLSYFWHDITSEKITEIYDTVIMNPPFHEGRVTEPGLGQAFIAAAASRLKPGGRLLLVANRQLPYEITLKQLFRNVIPLGDASGFKIIEARK